MNDGDWIEVNREAEPRETSGGRLILKNKRLLRRCVIALTAVTLLCAVANGFLWLEKPVFIESYIELSMMEMDRIHWGDVEFELVYFTNSTDERSVKGITFEEAPEIQFRAVEYPGYGGIFAVPSPGQQRGRYSVRTVYVKMQSDQGSSDLSGRKLKHATIYFSDDSMQTVDVGLIAFRTDNPGDSLEFYSSNSSVFATGAEISGAVSWNSAGSLTLKRVEGSFLELEAPPYQLRIDGMDYKEAIGKSFKGSIRVGIVLANPQESGKLPVICEPIHRLVFEDETGEEYSCEDGTMYHFQHWYQQMKPWQILQYCRTKEVK